MSSPNRVVSKADRKLMDKLDERFFNLNRAKNSKRVTLRTHRNGR